MYSELLDYCEWLYSYESTVHIIFFSLLFLTLFFILLKRLKYDFAIIKKIKYYDYPFLLNIPLFLLSVFVVINLFIFFMVPDRIVINPTRIASISSGEVMDVDAVFHEQLQYAEHDLTPNITISHFFGYYNPIFFVEIVASLFFIYIIIITILFGNDFI